MKLYRLRQRENTWHALHGGVQVGAVPPHDGCASFNATISWQSWSRAFNGRWDTLARWVIGIALALGEWSPVPGSLAAAPSQEHSSGAGLYLPALPFSAAISPLPTAQGAANAANLTASSTLTVQPQTRPTPAHTTPTFIYPAVACTCLPRIFRSTLHFARQTTTPQQTWCVRPALASRARSYPALGNQHSARPLPALATQC